MDSSLGGSIGPLFTTDDTRHDPSANLVAIGHILLTREPGGVLRHTIELRRNPDSRAPECRATGETAWIPIRDAATRRAIQRVLPVFPKTRNTPGTRNEPPGTHRRPDPIPESEPEIEWTFKCRLEHVDIDRCLREAFEAGAREVTISTGGQVPLRVFLHTSVWPLVREAMDRRSTVAAVSRFNGWLELPPRAEGVLAETRKAEQAAAAAKAALMVRTTVHGTR